MFIKMKESKGFTLVELMIVVAIIGILAAVAVPFYQRYIQKSRLTSKVWPGVHAIQTNLATLYSFKNTLGFSTTEFNAATSDADLSCFTAAYPSAASGLRVVINSVVGGTCDNLVALHNSTIIFTPTLDGNRTKIKGWVVGGPLATKLGLEGEK